MPLTIENHTEDTIVLGGDTRKYKDTLKKLGGKWTPDLENGAGWIFPSNQLDLIEDEIRKVVHSRKGSDSDSSSFHYDPKNDTDEIYKRITGDRQNRVVNNFEDDDDTSRRSPKWKDGFKAGFDQGVESGFIEEDINFAINIAYQKGLNRGRKRCVSKEEMSDEDFVEQGDRKRYPQEKHPRKIRKQQIWQRIVLCIMFYSALAGMIYSMRFFRDNGNTPILDFIHSSCTEVYNFSPLPTVGM
jgi:hypothetical protein